ncbi:hypothetical protein PG994_006496 [Apiospora phragmitis]|uniref:Uncharacterized protein n=1 Tax=Apiospora phragmitis TaxID=2905665 RepID=A0ABR1VF86_9PEZI
MGHGTEPPMPRLRGGFGDALPEPGPLDARDGLAAEGSGAMNPVPDRRATRLDRKEAKMEGESSYSDFLIVLQPKVQRLARADLPIQPGKFRNFRGLVDVITATGASTQRAQGWSALFDFDFDICWGDMMSSSEVETTTTRFRTADTTSALHAIFPRRKVGTQAPHQRRRTLDHDPNNCW